MNSTIYDHGAALSDCVVPLDADGEFAVQAYWQRVIWEEWEPPTRFVPRAVPLPEDERRARRQARRAMARVAAAGRLAAVIELRPAVAATFGGEAA